MPGRLPRPRIPPSLAGRGGAAVSEPPEEGEEQQGLRTQQLALKQLQKCDITSGSPAGLEAARGRKSQVFSSLSRVEARLGLHRVVLTSPGMSVQLLLTPHPPRNVSVPHRCVPFPSTPPCLSPWDLPAGGRASHRIALSLSLCSIPDIHPSCPVLPPAWAVEQSSQGHRPWGPA